MNGLSCQKLDGAFDSVIVSVFPTEFFFAQAMFHSGSMYVVLIVSLID